MGCEVVVWRVAGVSSGEVVGVLGVMSASAWWSYLGRVSDVVRKSGVEAGVGGAEPVGEQVWATVVTCTKLHEGISAQ